MLAGMGIQHELDQGPMQAGSRPLHDHEPGAGDGDGGFKIQQTQGFPKIHVVFGFKSEFLRIAPAAHLFIIILRLSRRDCFVGYVRDPPEAGV